MRSRSLLPLALSLALPLAAVLLMNACRTPPANAPKPSVAKVRDPDSYSEPQKVAVKHLSLALAVDFTAKALRGTVTFDLTWSDPAVRQLILDGRDLTIAKAEAGDGTTWQDVPFQLAPADKRYGSKITVELPAQLPKVRLSYATSPNASGLQWMPAELTLGKKQPLMFSQSQAIHARSWVPLQDTPSVRFTYDAHITTPPEVMALMSATNDPQAARDGDYRFEMPQPVPSYLMAIAVGDLVFRPLSARAGVWAEPGMADRAAREFEDTEKMIVTAEKLYGPYRWGRYDVLVLPPSFPFGGMENPRLTFATPTIVVGDKSLVSLIAHELAHSWSGNLVTNALWSSGWLNEGFTTYVEARIVEELYGREVADMELVVGQEQLRESIAGEIPVENQVLAPPPVDGADPEGASGDIVYIKGQWFLLFLEQRYGRQVFDAFLRSWFDAHAFSSVDSMEFKRFLEQELVAKHPGKTTPEEINTWMHEPGIPSFAPWATSTRFAVVDAAAADWLAGKVTASALPSAGWGTYQWVRFLLRLPRSLPAEKLAELDAAHRLTGTPNPEIAERWYPLAVRSKYAAAQPEIRKYLISIGRRKLIIPIYDALVETPEGLTFAQASFAEAKAGYHPITIASVEELLAKASAKASGKAAGPSAEQPKQP
jgi:leukotriene-A4 hydrolase